MKNTYLKWIETIIVLSCLVMALTLFSFFSLFYDDSQGISNQQFYVTVSLMTACLWTAILAPIIIAGIAGRSQTLSFFFLITRKASGTFIVICGAFVSAVVSYKFQLHSSLETDDYPLLFVTNIIMYYFLLIIVFELVRSIPNSKKTEAEEEISV